MCKKLQKQMPMMYKIIGRAIFMLIMFVGVASGATYYIGPNGDYSTIAAFKSAVPTPADDSNVYFECGNTFVPTTRGFEINWNGTRGGGVTIGAYYVEASTKVIGVSGKKPILTGSDHTYPYPSDDVPNYWGLIRWFNKDYINIQDLEITESRGHGIKIEGDKDLGQSSQFFSVRRCKIHKNYMSAIIVSECRENHGSITDNEITDNAKAGNWDLGLFPSHPVIISVAHCPSANMTISKNTLYSNWGEDIGVWTDSSSGNSNSGYVRIHDNNLYGRGLLYVDGVRDVHIYRNLIVGGNYAGGTYGGVRFARSSGIAIGNETYKFQKETTDVTRNIYVYNNLVANCARGIYISSQFDNDTFRNIKILNNTFIANYQSVSEVKPSLNYVDCEFRNNVTYVPGDTIHDYDINFSSKAPDWTFTNNAGPRSESYGTGWRNIDSNWPTHISNWQDLDLKAVRRVTHADFLPTTGTNLEDAGYDVGNEYALTVNPAGSDYTIGNFEVDIVSQYDYGSYDIGGLVYTASSTPAPPANFRVH